MVDETLEARRWLHQRLGVLATQYPELKDAEHQQRLEAILEAQQVLADGETTPCFECGAPALHEHHVVPRVLRGTKTLPLCEQCHRKVHESDLRISALTALALQDKRDKGQKLGGRVPYGRQLSADGVHLATNPHEQGVIRRVRDFWQRGLSSRKIAAQLAEQGLYSRLGTPFTPSAIRNMVKIPVPVEDISALPYNRITTEGTPMPYTHTGRDVGRPKTYQSDEDRPVTVSVRIPRDVYDRVERYVKMHPGMTLTEFFLDGARLRLDTPADPRDIILSDDNTVIQELQEMIRASVQAEIGKVRDFMGPHGSIEAPEVPGESVPKIAHDSNAVIQEASTKHPGRKSTLRQPILDLVRAHPEGLTAIQIKVHLDVDKNVGDVLQGMVRNHLLEKQGSGAQVRYRAVGAPQAPPTASHATPAPARRTTRTAQRA